MNQHGNQNTKASVNVYAYFGTSIKELYALRRKAEIRNVLNREKVLLICKHFKFSDDFIADFNEIIRLNLIAESIELKDVLNGVNLIYKDLDKLCLAMNDKSIKDIDNVLFVTRYYESPRFDKTIKIVKIIQTYNKALCNFNINRVFLLSSCTKTLEENIFIEFIRQRSMKVEIIGIDNLVKCIKKLFYIRSLIVNSESFPALVIRIVVKVSREIYKIHYAKFIYALSPNKLTINSKPNTIMLIHNHRPEILTQSHFPVMKELYKLGYYPISIIANNTESFKELSKSAAYDGIFLDTKATVRSLISHLVITLKMFSKWRLKQKNVFRSSPEFLLYSGIPLFEFIKIELDDLFSAALFRRLNYMHGLKIVLQLSNPVAVKPGAEQSELNVLIHNMLRDTNIFTFQFHHGQTLKVIFIEHYQSQLFALPGENVKRLYLAAGIDENRLAVTGMPRYDSIKPFKNKYTRELSKQILNIQNNRNTIIITYFYDDESPTRINIKDENMGHIFAQICADFNSFLFIKPHPGCDIHSLRKRFNLIFSKIDFKLVERVDLNWHLINASDLVIVVGLSTIIMEAMMLSQSRIIVLTDTPRTEFEQIFHGGVLQLRNYNNLYSAVDKLISDKELCTKLQNNQKVAFALERGVVDGKNAERVAKTIHDKLRLMNELSNNEVLNERGI